LPLPLPLPLPLLLLLADRSFTGCNLTRGVFRPAVVEVPKLDRAILVVATNHPAAALR
jgi:hypothetical protein